MATFGKFQAMKYIGESFQALRGIMKQIKTMFLQITDQQAEVDIYKMAPRKAIMDLKELTAMNNGQQKGNKFRVVPV